MWTSRRLQIRMSDARDRHFTRNRSAKSDQTGVTPQRWVRRLRTWQRGLQQRASLSAKPRVPSARLS